jgi:hypothetical protein
MSWKVRKAGSRKVKAGRSRYHTIKKSRVKKSGRTLVKSVKKKKKKQSGRRRYSDGRRDGTSEGKTILIESGKYNRNFLNYNHIPFLKTLSFFRNTVESKDGKNIQTLIKKLFTFNKDESVFRLFVQKQTIVGYIILSGWYDKFEVLLMSLYEAKKDDDKNIKVDCNEKPKDEIFNRDSKSQLRYLNALNIFKAVEAFIAKNDIDVDVDLYTVYMEKKIHHEGVISTAKSKIHNKTSVVTEISKFIYHVICTVNKFVLTYILRHYFLSFLKSDMVQRYKRIISYDKTDNNISDFFGVLGIYKPFQYITTSFVKKNGRMYNFATCGETTLLNLMNYLLIKESNPIDIDKHPKFSPELKAFYRKYNTLDKQAVNEEATIQDWFSVVSNLDDDSIYDRFDGDIIPNLKNMIVVLQIILGEGERGEEGKVDNEQDEMSLLLNKVNESISIDVDEQQNQVIITLDKILVLSLTSQHAETTLINNDVGKKKNPVVSYPGKFTDNDYFGVLYDLINEHDDDLSSRREVNISSDIHQGIKMNGLLPIYLDFIKTLTSFYLWQEEELYEVPYYIEFMTGLTSLQLVNCNIREIPSFVVNLKRLKILNLKGNEIETVHLFDLPDLEQLLLLDNKITNIILENLPKLDRLDLRNNKLESIPSSMYSLNWTIELLLKGNSISMEDLRTLERTFPNVW